MTEETTTAEVQEENPAQEVEQHEPEHVGDAQQEDSSTSDDSADTAANSKKKGVQKRIDELTANWRNTERDRDYWRQLAMQSMQKPEQQQQAETPQKEATPERPQEDQYEDYSEYLEAVADWKAEVKLREYQQRQEQERRQTQAQQTKQQKQQTFVENAQKMQADAPDFWQVATTFPMSDAMEEAILDSEQGPQVAYHLGQHPEQATRIAQMSPYAAAREIGRLEQKLSIPTKPATTSAPDPVKPVGGSGEGRTKTPDQMSTKEWMAWRNKQAFNR